MSGHRAHGGDQLTDDTAGNSAPAAMGYATGIWRYQNQTWAIRAVYSQGNRGIIAHHAIGLSQSCGIGVGVNDTNAMHLTRDDTALDLMAG